MAPRKYFVREAARNGCTVCTQLVCNFVRDLLLFELQSPQTDSQGVALMLLCHEKTITEPLEVFAPVHRAAHGSGRSLCLRGNDFPDH